MSNLIHIKFNYYAVIVFFNSKLTNFCNKIYKVYDISTYFWSEFFIIW